MDDDHQAEFGKLYMWMKPCYTFVNMIFYAVVYRPYSSYFPEQYYPWLFSLRLTKLRNGCALMAKRTPSGDYSVGGNNHNTAEYFQSDELRQKCAIIK